MSKNNKKNNKKSEVKENWSIATVWPNEIIASYKVKGNAIGRIRWDKPNDYGEQHTVRTWAKSVDVSTDPDVAEWHPISVEVMNLPTAGWVAGSYEDNNNKTSKKNTKGDDDDSGIKPSIPFTRESTFTRKDTETGADIVEKFGEAMWILREVFQPLIEEKLANAKANGELKMFMGKRKLIDPFSLYRPYNAKEDKDKEVITIDDEDKVERDVPTFKVNVSFDKKTNYITANIRDLSKAKKKQDGTIIIPEAKYGGDKLTRTTIGKFMPKTSLISGIVTFGDVKSHKFGLSQPFDIGFKKMHPDDEKGQRLLFVKPNKSEGLKSKLTQDQYNLQMLGDNVSADNGQDDDDDENDFAKNAKAKKNAAKKKVQVDSDDEPPQDSDDEEPPKGKNAKNGKNIKKDDSDDEEEPPKGKNAKNNKNAKKDDSEDDEEEPPKGKNAKNGKNTKKEDSEDDEEPPKGKNVKKSVKDDDIDSDEEDTPKKGKNAKKSKKEESENEDDEEPKSKNNKKGNNKKSSGSDDEEEDEEPPKSKSSKNNKSKGKKNDDIEEADVDEIETDDE